jgi:hypothetical protein
MNLFHATFLARDLSTGLFVKVVFGEPDKMFRLIAEALAPSNDSRISSRSSF